MYHLLFNLSNKVLIFGANSNLTNESEPIYIYYIVFLFYSVVCNQ